MAPKKPLFEASLHECSEIGLLPWVAPGIFSVKMKSMKKADWSPGDAQHFVHWDNMNYKAGFPDRKPRSTREYFRKARHRFKQALKSLVEQKKLKRFPKLDGEDSKAYSFVTEDYTRYLLPPVQASPLSSADITLSINPQEEKKMFVLILYELQNQNITNQNAEQTHPTRKQESITNVNYGMKNVMSPRLSIDSSLGGSSSPSASPSSGASTPSEVSSSVEGFNDTLLKYSMLGTGHMTPSPTMAQSVDSLRTPPHDVQDMPLFTQIPASQEPVNKEQSLGTLQTPPNDIHGVPSFAHPPVTQVLVNIEQNPGTLRTPPNEHQEVSSFIRSFKSYIPVGIEQGIGTLQNPDNVIEQMYSPVAQAPVNTVPATGTLQTPQSIIHSLPTLEEDLQRMSSLSIEQGSEESRMQEICMDLPDLSASLSFLESSPFLSIEQGSEESKMCMDFPDLSASPLFLESSPFQTSNEVLQSTPSFSTEQRSEVLQMSTIDNHNHCEGKEHIDILYQFEQSELGFSKLWDENAFEGMLDNPNDKEYSEFDFDLIEYMGL